MKTHGDVPEETTLSPDDARRVLANSRSARRRTENIVLKAEVTFSRSRTIGEANGFVDSLRDLIRGTA